mmetsp:Transcript_92782/g.198949  ORF Transcript_92782/g.198949 Transcript_92782/m.198949 type:complete len:220 (-) Transcript_92782:66-725(-)
MPCSPCSTPTRASTATSSRPSLVLRSAMPADSSSPARAGWTYSTLSATSRRAATAIAWPLCVMRAARSEWSSGPLASAAVATLATFTATTPQTQRPTAASSSSTTLAFLRMPGGTTTKRRGGKQRLPLHCSPQTNPCTCAGSRRTICGCSRRITGTRRSSLSSSSASCTWQGPSASRTSCTPRRRRSCEAYPRPSRHTKVPLEYPHSVLSHDITGRDGG